MIDGGRLRTRVRCRTGSSAAALFADISGFTPLTEALAAELGPQRGAEELTANLGRVFHAVIDELDRRGGDVIYFAGDAITCWLDGDDGTRATAAALAMQEAMAREGTIHTPGGTDRPARPEGGRGLWPGPPLRRRRPRHPAHRRVGRLADRRPRGGRALRPERGGRPGSVRDGGSGRPRPPRRTAGSIRRPAAPSRSSRSCSSRSRRSRSRNPWPSMRPRSGRGCCPRSTSACARVAGSCWRSSVRRSRCSCGSPGSITTTIPTPCRSSTTSCGPRSGSWPATAATFCS